MKIDAYLSKLDITDLGPLAAAAEQTGFDGVWVTEETDSPYTQLALAAQASSEIDIGSAIALAFPRSPMVTAYTAWGLQRLSGGRILLGLGPQVKGHMVRRFSVDFDWEQPGPRLRDYINAVRHIWSAWEDETDVQYEGEFYDITLCPEEFTPAPLETPIPEVYVAGVNPYLLKLAGHRCDGLHIHPAHTPAYINEVVLPNVEKGAELAGRDLEDITLSTQVFTISGAEEERDTARETVRQRIGFYGSTRTYRTIFEVHGWGGICETLHERARQGRWDELSEYISDEMVAAFSIEADWPDLRTAIEARYEHVDRVSVYRPYDGHDRWSHLVSE